MLLRFQLSDRALAEMLRARFQRKTPCITAPIGGSGANAVYLDHLAFEGTAPVFTNRILEPGAPQPVQVPHPGGATTTLTSQPVILNRPVRIFTTTRSELEQAVNGTPATTEGVLPLRFSLSVEHVDFTDPRPWLGRPQRFVFDQLKVTFEGLGPITDEALRTFGAPRAAVEQFLKGAVPPVTTPLDLASALAGFPAGPSRPNSVWSGLALSTDGSRVEIRVELRTDRDAGVEDVSMWQRFYGGDAVDDLVGGEDWALAIDKEFIVDAIAAVIGPAVKDADKFVLESGPSYTWDGKLPGVVADLAGKKIDACDCFWGKISVHVEVTVHVTFQLAAHLLRIDVRLDHRSTRKWELVCCELTAAAVWELVDIEALTGEQGKPLALGPLAMFVAAIGQAARAPTSAATPAGFTKEGEGHFYADQAVTQSLNSEDETYVLESVRGTDATLILSGSHTDKNLRQGIVGGTVNPFVWLDPNFDCSSVRDEFTAHAEIMLSKQSGDLEPEFCLAQVTPAEFAAPVLSESFDYSPYRVHVNLDTTREIPGAARVLVFSHGGVRLFEVPPMPHLTEEQRDDFSRTVRAWRSKHCYTREDEWFKYFKRFNIKWLIDPAHLTARSKRHWLVGLGGARPGDRLVFTANEGDRVFSAFADRNGQVAADFVSEAESLLLVREPDTGKEPIEDAQPPQLTLRNVLVAHIATVRPGGALLAMQLLRVGGRSELIAATDEGVRRFEIGTTGRLSLLGCWSGRLAGAAALAGSLYGWSESHELVDLARASGAAIVSAPDGELTEALRAAVEGGAEHVGTARGALVAARGRIIVVRSGFEEEERSLELPGEVIRLADDSAIVAGEEGLSTYRISADGEAELISISHEMPLGALTTNGGGWLAAPGEATDEIELMTVVAERTM